MRAQLRVAPGAVDVLAGVDPSATVGLPRSRRVVQHPRRWAQAELARLGRQLASHQDRLYARAKVGAAHQRVLVVLQAMDCGGKDATVRKVVGAMNPQGLSVTAFGKPTAQELTHDFLWRIRRALPQPGYLGVFNRSHYEDVLVVRVDQLVAPPIWQERYDTINTFERELTDRGVTIIKVMLHISFGEQTRRLARRLADPTRSWKYSPTDIDERGLWSAYQAAYDEMLTRCSTEYAPWFVVPADRPWYRDWAVAMLLLETLTDLGLTYPEPAFDPRVERGRLYATDPLHAPMPGERADHQRRP